MLSLSSGGFAVRSVFIVGLLACLSGAIVSCSSSSEGTGAVEDDGGTQIPPASLDAARDTKKPPFPIDMAMPAPDTAPVCNAGAKKDIGAACGCDQECGSGSCGGGKCCTGAGCKKPLGATCGAAGDCASGFCADGVCCNVACDGACLSCTLEGSVGECMPAPVGQTDPRGKCRLDSEKSCGQTGKCNGLGGCAVYAAKTICQKSECNAATNELNPAGECDGQGTCVLGKPIKCDPNKCENGACRTTCDNDTQCVGRKCDLVQKTCGQRGNGQTCKVGGECMSGFCADGVCCDKACNGACAYCAYPNALGKCTNAAAGVADPHKMCSNETCKQNGKCDGKGVCQRYAEGSACGNASCNAGSNKETPVGKCQNSACVQDTNDCAPYKGCSGNSCAGSCSSDSQCVAPNLCRDGRCGSGAGVGSQCSQDRDCQNGVCSQGRCCESRCDGLCRSCNVSGSLGKCVDVPAGNPDPGGKCTGACDQNCDGKGACKKASADTVCKTETTCPDAAGTVKVWQCTAAGECASKTETCAATEMCMGNKCVPKKKHAAGEDCLEASDCVDGLVCLKNVCATKPLPGAGETCAAEAVGGKTCTGDLVCTGSKQCCPAACNDTCSTGCDSTGACKKKCPNQACEAGVCKAQKGQACGAAASNVACESGKDLHCVSGICCGGPCKDGDVCTDGVCKAPPDVCAVTCGDCTKCSGGACVADKDKENAVCGAGGKGKCSATGVCVLPLAAGAACTTGPQCASGSCLAAGCCAAEGTCGACTAHSCTAAGACAPDATKNNTACMVGTAAGKCASGTCVIDADAGAAAQ